MPGEGLVDLSADTADTLRSEENGAFKEFLFLLAGEWHYEHLA